jgi:hypothetical protein
LASVCIAAIEFPSGYSVEAKFGGFGSAGDIRVKGNGSGVSSNIGFI